MLMVDCSHVNSVKQPARQEEVWNSIINQRAVGTRSVIGAMLESNFNEGNRPFPGFPGFMGRATAGV